MTLTWEEGIIGQYETFQLKRFPFNPMWARALGTTLTSAAAHKLVIKDKKGPVRANIFFTYIGSSGIGYKSPPLRMTREILSEFDKKKLSPTKFTPQGFTEYVEGTSGEVRGKKSRKEIPPHPVNVILRDEISELLGELRSPHLAEMKQYMSKLWDGWIEGYYTRKAQFEGGIPVYVSLCAAGSTDFYDLLEESFFTQGLGNRILWVTETKIKPTRQDEEEFFFPDEDVEFEKLKEDIIGKLKQIETLKGWVTLAPGAAKRWCDFEYQYTSTAANASDGGSYIIKIPLNVLKLAMLYSTSKLQIDKGYLWVTEEDMVMAIEDAKNYESMWKDAMWQWGKKIVEGKSERLVPTSMYDLKKYVAFAIQHNDLVSKTEISAELVCPDKTRVGDILETGVDKGWFIVIANQSDTSKLTPEQIKRFKPLRGYIPTIYKATVKGKEEYKIA
jgi:hypothetical protein